MDNLKYTFEVYANKEDILIARFKQLITGPEENAKQAELVVAELISIVRQSPGKKFNVLIDLMPLKEASYISDRTREIYIQAMKDEQLRKLAVIGESSAYREVLNFLIATIKGDSKIRWFTDVKKAIGWLKQDR